MKFRVWGRAGVAGLLIRREGRTAVGSNPMAESDRRHDGPNSAQEGEGDAPRRADLAAQSSAVGPKAQEGVSEQAAGQNRKLAASTKKETFKFSNFRSFS